LIFFNFTSAIIILDNWALLFAQKLALKNKLPLHVVFCLTDKFPGATLRTYKFMLDGLEEVAEDLKDLDINFHLLRGNHTTQIPKFVKDFGVGALVCDFSPLRIHREWVDGIKDKMPSNVSFVQVDAHNIVPIWIASDKQEYAARTIRNKINSKLGEFLSEFPPLIKHPHKADKSGKSEKIDWNETLESVKPDKSVGEVDWLDPGYQAGVAMISSFINSRLKNYDEARNDPNKNALSNLSPYFHYGQIAVQRAILEAKRHKTSSNSKSVEAFMEEAIVRRELSDNFCFYNKNYDNLNGATDWARKTLNDHRKDKREYLYSLKEFEDAKTHDDLWNAAQLQMKKEGIIF
jgi:deoxyribodipyrimidine photo-lyase